MPAIDRIKSKYLDQNPTRQEQFAVPPDWVIAVAAVLDELQEQIRRLETARLEAEV